MSSEAHKLPGWLDNSAAVAGRVLILLGLAYALSIAFRTLHLLVVPIIYALFIAAILSRPTQALRRYKIPLVLSAALGAALFVVMLAATVLAAALILHGQHSDIASAVGRGWQALEQAIAKQGGSFAGLSIEDMSSRASQVLGSRSDEMADLLATGAAGVVTATTEVILGSFIAFYFLRDGHQLVHEIIAKLPEKTAALVRSSGGRMWNQLESYMLGTAALSLVNSLVFGAALYLLDVPFVLAIIFIMFVGSFVPYLGPLLATAIAALVALGNNGGLITIWVLGIGALIQVVEGNLLQPLVMSHALRMPPLLVLLAVTCGTAVAGFIGTFVAVPLTAAIAVLFETREENGEGVEDVVAEDELG